MSLGMMTIRIIALVFIFIARLRFPLDLSMAEVLRNRSAADLVKMLENWRKLTTNTANYNLSWQIET